jgi:starvation-inducible DNA-binding protein
MTTQTAPAPEGIETGSVADQLARLLADTYVLYLKTHAYHWNVTGPHFASLHAMFEQQYLELRDAVDVIAERIRAIGPMAPGSYRQMAELSNLSEDETVPEALEMVRRLADDHDRVAATAADALKAAEKADDQVTVDLATQRSAIHEKTRWMLRAIVG